MASAGYPVQQSLSQVILGEVVVPSHAGLRANVVRNLGSYAWPRWSVRQLVCTLIGWLARSTRSEPTLRHLKALPNTTSRHPKVGVATRITERRGHYLLVIASHIDEDLFVVSLAERFD